MANLKDEGKSSAPTGFPFVDDPIMAFRPPGSSLGDAVRQGFISLDTSTLLLPYAATAESLHTVLEAYRQLAK